MEGEYPASAEDADTGWLSEVLTESRVLGRGSVAAMRYHDNDAFNSTVAHLEVAYSEGVPADAPRRLLLKLNAEHEGELEVGLYDLVANEPGHPPVLPRCYAAAYSKQTGRSYLLLEDLSGTHEPTVTRRELLSLRGVPPAGRMDGVVEALARFHAYWWEHPILGTGVGRIRPWYNDLPAYERHIQRREREWAGFLAAEGDGLPMELRALYERVLAGMPRLWGRCLERRVTRLERVTLTHGDCYLTQFLSPQEGVRDTARLVDF